MRMTKALPAALAGVFLLGACANLDLSNVRGMNVTGTAFHKELHKEYSRLAKEEFDEVDFVDAAFFNDRARRAALGQDFGPQEISERDEPADALPLLTASRERLMQEYAHGAALSKPIPAAKAQAAFDCWLEEQEENFQPDDIAACRDAFMAALREVRAVAPQPKMVEKPAPQMAEKKPAPKPMAEIKRDYLVFFNWNSATLSPEAKAIIKTAVDNAKKGKVSTIKATGHADRSGPAAYNLTLSKRRAMAVADELIRLGVDPAEIGIDYKGETDPLVPTPDGVREPQNRRVEIVLEKSF